MRLTGLISIVVIYFTSTTFFGLSDAGFMDSIMTNMAIKKAVSEEVFDGKIDLVIISFALILSFLILSFKTAWLQFFLYSFIFVSFLRMLTVSFFYYIYFSSEELTVKWIPVFLFIASCFALIKVVKKLKGFANKKSVSAP